LAICRKIRISPAKKAVFVALSIQNKIKQKSSQTAALVEENSIQKTKNCRFTQKPAV
jgi:hypothetical protein